MDELTEFCALFEAEAMKPEAMKLHNEDELYQAVNSKLTARILICEQNIKAYTAFLFTGTAVYTNTTDSLANDEYEDEYMTNKEHVQCNIQSAQGDLNDNLFHLRKELDLYEQLCHEKLELQQAHYKLKE